MYSLKNVLAKNPVQISGAVIGVVDFAVIVGWLTMAAESVAALNVMLIGLLGLFVTNTTVNMAKLEDLTDGGNGGGDGG